MIGGGYETIFAISAAGLQDLLNYLPRITRTESLKNWNANQALPRQITSKKNPNEITNIAAAPHSPSNSDIETKQYKAIGNENNDPIVQTKPNIIPPTPFPMSGLMEEPTLR